MEQINTNTEYLDKKQRASNIMAELDPKIGKLRDRFHFIVMNDQTNEDNWRCDICLSKENEDDDPLTQCDLCLVVVHPACYRRDLYEEDIDDD